MIDLLTIGNLSQNVLHKLSDLRAKYNIVSCRSNVINELVTASKLVLQQCKSDVFVNNEKIDFAYLEDYIEHAANAAGELQQKPWHVVALNKTNCLKLLELDKMFNFTEDSICIVVISLSEFQDLMQLPVELQTYLDQHRTIIRPIFTDLPYEYTRMIPAIQMMLENGLDDKGLLVLDADTQYSSYAIGKMHRLIRDTDNTVITSVTNNDTLFDTIVLSNKFTYVKPKFFNDLLWQGLRPAIISTSLSNYWHTFNLWTAHVNSDLYYCKFHNIVDDVAISAKSCIKMKMFYNELARMGVTKLLLESSEFDNKISKS